MPYTLFIFLLAGFTQGVSGFGAGLVAMPLLTLVLGIKAAVPLSMLNGLIITGYLSLQLKGHIDWRKILPLLIGCQPGIFLGALALKSMNADLLQLGLGAFISLYAIYSLSTPPKPRTISRRWGYVAGFLTGVISSVFSAGGPPAVIYVSLTGWAKDEIKATLSVFFFVSGIITAIGHAINGLTTPAVLQHFAWTAPITLAGVLAGSLLYRRIKQRTYIAIMLWLLILMGVMMIVIAGYRLLG
ncbi:MAG: sulfite exporter TauE/SafE family protein [Proteobacteria bacterium]|nr:sulfite exporter TauE/SafE family protein [Desulfobulbaceae bacterium]MBU4154275.1 sulfite exporter TauE/SafE family protein [Pseudomonadota bacterium]